MFLHCELALGAGWVCAPGRWPTSDGCVPIWLVPEYFAALSLRQARAAMDTARGIGLAFGSEDSGRRAWDAAFDEAYPPIDAAAGGE